LPELIYFRKTELISGSGSTETSQPNYSPSQCNKP